MSAWRDCARCFSRVEGLSGRNAAHEELFKYFKGLPVEDIVYASYLAIARVSPEAEGAEMNTGEAILLKALSAFSCTPVKEIKARAKARGDISMSIDLDSGSAQKRFIKRKTLLLSEVFTWLQRLLNSTGKNSQKKKIEEITYLLSRCTEKEEIKYLIRILDGKLKIGVSLQSILCSLGMYFAWRDTEKESNNQLNNEIINTDGQKTKEMIEKVKSAYAQLPSIKRIIEIFTTDKKSMEKEEDAFITPGHPLRPMLAIAEKDIPAIITRFKEKPFIAEYKYDGERIQIHRKSGEVKLFSRGLENTTERFIQAQEIVNRSCIDANSDFIIDAEVVAYNQETQKVLDFQVLSKRKRKAPTEKRKAGTESAESDIALFLFDILYFNQSLIKLPIMERKAVMKKYFNEIEGKLFIVQTHTLCKPKEEEIEKIFKQAVDSNCEGLMLKSTGEESTYEPSNRSQKWIKLKSDYVSGLHETLDLIVIGAYTGKGRRTGVHGGFLLGCLNENEEIETVTKIGTGFTDEQLKDHMENLRQYITEVPQVDEEGIIQPDTWFTPSVVWEISSAGISLSPTYTAGRTTGMLPEGKGLSLRFPRFLRRREDKSPSESTRSANIIQIYFTSITRKQE